MDYDDNDSQGHNHYLTGEGSSKLSPILRPYALPKFDFDDSLQSHLRFDSLVENEVFLGIPSQEDNQWIEDFSRGSSGIEFSSSATESCSISRRNNVWSEATSSESVEMLLKSVGQEESIRGETIIEESDAVKELDPLTKDMEPSSKHNDKTEDDIHLLPTLPPDIPGGWDEDARAKHPNAECTLESQKDDPPVHESSVGVGSNVSSGIIVIDENIKTVRENDDANEMEVQNSVKEPLVDSIEELRLVPAVQIDNTSSFSHGVAANSEVSDNQANEYKVSDVPFKDISGEIVENVGRSDESEIVDQMPSENSDGIYTNNAEDPPHVALEKDSIVEHKFEINVCMSEGVSGSPVKGDPDLQIAEDCKTGVGSSDPSQHHSFEAVDCSGGTEICKLTRDSGHEDSPVVCLGDKSPKEKVIDVDNTKIRISAGPKLETGTVEGKEGLECDKGMDNLGDQNIAVSNKKAGCFSHSEMDRDSVVENRSIGGDCHIDIRDSAEASSLVEKELVEQGKESVIDNVGDLSTLTAPVSSTGLLRGRSSSEDFSGVSNSSRVLNEDIFAEDRSPTLMPNRSIQLNETKVSSEEDGKHNCDQDASFHEKGKELPTDSSDMECRVVISSCSDEYREGKGLVAREAEIEGSTKNEPDSKLVVEHKNLSSCDTMNGGTVSVADEVTSHDDHQNRPVLGFISDDTNGNEKVETKVCEDASSSGLKESSKEATDLKPASEAAKAAELASNKSESLSKSLAEPYCHVGRKNDESIVATEAHTTGEISLTTKDDHQASIALATPSICVVDSASEDKDGPASMAKDTCEGPPAISSTELPLCENVQLVGIKGSKSQDVEGSPSISGHSQKDHKMVQGISHESPQAPVGRRTGTKGTAERRTRRSSGKAAARETSKKGNNLKETSLRQSEKLDTSMVFTHSPGTGQLLQFEELKPCGDVDRSSAKPFSTPTIPTSNLPDLNSSALPAPLFQQPFTDLQQVQLRAQIIVYGSLIQESVPDEACMISAFGPSGGGGNLWEPSWRACIERVRTQKSRDSNLGTHAQSRSGGKATDQSVKHSSYQSKVLTTPSGRPSSKGIPSGPSPIGNPIIPLSSPLWNVSTPACDGLQSSGMAKTAAIDYHQPLSPLHPYQSPAMRNFSGNNPSWLSQTSFQGQWIASSQTSAFDSNARFSVFPNTEPVKLTPAKDSSARNLSAIKDASVSQDGGGAIVSSETSSQPDRKMETFPSALQSAAPKPRKRKKNPTTESSKEVSFPDSSQLALVCTSSVSNQLSKPASLPEAVEQKSLRAQSRTESVPAPVFSNLFTTSVAVTTPSCFTSTSKSGTFFPALSPSLSSDQPKGPDQNVDKLGKISEVTLNTVEEAKLQAETAAANATNAVNHCHDVWDQLNKQKNLGLISDNEAKLASAAVTVKAAASVAKAAAAAAMIASNVAVQAKLMAAEVSASSVTGNLTQGTGQSLSNVSNSLENATPFSILKGGDVSVPTSIIAVAREAARKRVEAASAASKHAENLDAIVKAAELAAEAVSQAGKIVSIGDPLPLSRLVELGPERYWKNPQLSTEQGSRSHTLNADQRMTLSVELHNVTAVQSKVGPSVMGEAKKSGIVASPEKDLFSTETGRGASGLGKTISFAPESEAGSRSASVNADDEMKEGCLVEVYKDGGNYKAAWYTASVLNLKDGKAFLCYAELQADEGGQLKEWVPLEHGIQTPTIRICHPTTAMRFDGTRKRRRAAIVDHTWSVGDRVDAWMQDCWREGIIKEKNKNDATAYTIHFPALGDAATVRAWHLRPTLTWQNGEWIEWSGEGPRSPSQGDAPQEKRMKLGNPSAEAKANDKMPRDVDTLKSKKGEESKLLPLLANEKEFNVGRNTRHENKLETQRTTRTGLQKQGSRVVFGVPKPGKKRKFMDVSTHFDDQSNKNVKTSDSVKFAKYLMPQGSGSRGWKHNSKIDVKEKQAAEEKAKVHRSVKPPYVSGRTLTQKDNSTAAESAHGATLHDRTPEDAISNEENDTSQQNLMEPLSNSNFQGSEGTSLVSSLDLQQIAPKKRPSTKDKSEPLNKGKLASAGGRLGKKVELQEKSVPEVVEPRRSNRKIQPTSRLLEGLQSSLIISKMPFSHDKGHRSQSKSNFKGNINHG